MIAILKLITVFVCVLGVNSQGDEGFNNFVKMAMQDYPAWLISQGLDPTPIIPEFINITQSSANFYIEGGIKNQQMFNYSNIATNSVNSDIFGGKFTIRVNIQNFKVEAEYNVSGKVLGSLPITGFGAATFKSSYADPGITYENYAITEDGYVDLSVAMCRDDLFPYFRDLEGDFETFSAGGFEDTVKDLILKTYDTKKDWLMFLVCQHIQEYLTGVFEKTPLSEIILTTLPPPPTTTTATTSTIASTYHSTGPTAVPVTNATTPSTTTTSHTCPPPGELLKDPKFSRNVYESYLAVWPQRGDQINLGIEASLSDGYTLQYQLISRYPVIKLTETQNLNFTSDVAEGAYVGPNNVMVMEVIAEVVGDPRRQSSAAVIIVFPKSGLVNNNDEAD